MWFKASDLDSVEDEDEKKRVMQEFKVCLTRNNMDEKLKVKLLSWTTRVRRQVTYIKTPVDDTVTPTPDIYIYIALRRNSDASSASQELLDDIAASMPTIQAECLIWQPKFCSNRGTQSL